MASLAFIGITHIHTPAFVNQIAELGLPVAAIHDPNEERARPIAERFGCPLVSGDEIVNDSAVSHVILCGETVHHAHWVPLLAAAKKAMFIEKPLGMGEADAKLMMTAIDEAEVPCQTGYFVRGNSKVRTIKKWVDEGRFGTVTRLRYSNCHHGALHGWFDNDYRWMADLAQAGVGAFGDLGTHGLDILLWLGGHVTEATGFLSPGLNRYPGCDELGEGIMRFESGAIGSLAASWDDWANPLLLYVTGTDGAAWIYEGDLFARWGEGGSTYKVDEELEAEVPAGFTAFLDHFQGKPAELVPAAEMYERNRVMEMMYKASGWTA